MGTNVVDAFDPDGVTLLSSEVLDRLSAIGT